MIYDKEINNLLREIFFDESWMDESDWEEFLETMVDNNIINYDTIDKEIEVGINNGYSLERQLKIIEQIYQNRFYSK